MSQEIIINGFKATGLYPWDPSAIPDAAYAPSLLTETSNQLQQIPGQIQSPSRTLSPIHTQNFDSDDTHYDDMLPSLLFDETFANEIQIDIYQKDNNQHQKNW